MMIMITFHDLLQASQPRIMQSDQSSRIMQSDDSDKSGPVPLLIRETISRGGESSWGLPSSLIARGGGYR